MALYSWTRKAISALVRHSVPVPSLPGLDADVLRLIHEFVFAQDDYDGWQNELPMLAVCRSWRTHLLPVVYRTAFVLLDGRSDISIVSGVQSNISLIQKLGLAGVVKTLYIRNPIQSDSLSRVMGVMGTLEESGDWSTVTDLELDVANTALNPYDNHDPAYVRKWMGSVVDPMYKHLPNLRYLHFSGSASHQVAHYIYIGIAEKYSGQIKRLRTRQSVSFGNQIRLEQPASLDLRVEQLYPNFHPIRARPDSLVSLKLYWCLKSTFWMMFGDDPTTVSGVLAFPCLKTLDLKALLRDVQPGNPRYLPCSTKVGQLHFPALENLKLKGNPSNAMQILQSSKLPSHMVSIELELHETMLDEVTSFGLPKADRMALETYVQGDVADAKTIHAFSAIGELFKSAGASVEARLQLFNMVPELDFTSMGFDGLTELYLYSSVNSAEVLDILTRMQRLRTAHFCVGNLESSNPVLSVGAFDNRAGPVTPLNSSLRELNTRGMDDGNRGPHLALVKYLLVRLPRLQSYDSINVHFDEVAEFINRNAPLYPHLRQIELSLTPQYPVF